MMWFISLTIVAIALVVWSVIEFLDIIKNDDGYK